MKKPLVEIWGDVVDAKELTLSIVITTTLALGLHLLAPADNPTAGLFFGLAGAVTGFLISCVLFRPKRTVTKEGEE